MKHTFGMDGCDRCGKRESTSTRADLWHASSSGVQWKDTEDRERMLYGCRFDFCTWLAILGGVTFVGCCWKFPLRKRLFLSVVGSFVP